MRWWALLAVVGLTALGLTSSARATVEEPVVSRGAEFWPCTGDGLPDGPYCVHPNAFVLDEGEALTLAQNAHRTKSGWQTYEHLPRSPDRPADYEIYRYPVPPGPLGRSVVSGYDLDLPDPQQRRGANLRHVGHGGVDLPQLRGTPVHVVHYEHQEGDAEVLFTGEVFGRTVLLVQRIRQGEGALREYVTLFGHLEQIAPGLQPGMQVHDGDVIGSVGDSGSPGLVHLHLEIRRVRDEHSAAELLRDKGANALVTSAWSIPTDPRNLLPFR